MSAPAMRRTVPCAWCSSAARVLPCGFCTEAYLVCTARGDERVSERDGCTLGEPGEPMPAIVAQEATIPESPASAGVLW